MQADAKIVAAYLLPQSLVKAIKTLAVEGSCYPNEIAKRYLAEGLERDLRKHKPPQPYTN